MWFFKKLFQNKKADKATLGNTQPQIDGDIEKLSEEELRSLEGTEDRYYYLNKNDTRTEQELQRDFAAYFNNEKFFGYTIETDVSPAYFDESPYCKPLNFLFSKDGEAVLAIAIVKSTSISHPAVKDMQFACAREGIKYQRFIIGYPNTEHYVVRKTLEALGEIPCLYSY